MSRSASPSCSATFGWAIARHRCLCASASCSSSPHARKRANRLQILVIALICAAPAWPQRLQAAAGDARFGGARARLVLRACCASAFRSRRLFASSSLRQARVRTLRFRRTRASSSARAAPRRGSHSRLDCARLPVASSCIALGLHALFSAMRPLLGFPPGAALVARASATLAPNVRLFLTHLASTAALDSVARAFFASESAIARLSASR